MSEQKFKVIESKSTTSSVRSQPAQQVTSNEQDKNNQFENNKHSPNEESCQSSVANLETFDPKSVNNSSFDGTDEDIFSPSYWSDSATSQCDHQQIIKTSSPSSNVYHQGSSASIVITTANNNNRNSLVKIKSEQELIIVQNKSYPSGLSSTRQQSRAGGNINHHNGSGFRNVRKRVMANERERERTKSLNQALEILRNRLPVPEAEKRSKIQTLRMAKEYIEFLARFKRISQQQQQQSEVSNNLGTSNQTINRNLAQHANNSFETKSDSNNDDNDDSSQVNSIQQLHQPDSPLTYKFYKFRLKSQTNRND